MLELTDTTPPVNVLESEYARLLGYPRDHSPDGRARELSDWARQWYRQHGQPWVYVRQTEGLDLSHDRIRINGAEFTSGRLHEQLTAAQAHDAVLVAVSAGRQCEEKAHELWKEGKPDEYFFLEIYGSAVVEHLITSSGGRVCAWAEQNEMMTLPHYSPGYSGWDMSDQSRLWQLIRRAGAQRLPGELAVMDTGMLRPKKSLLALFGLTRHRDRVRHHSHLIPCHNCSMPGCQYRRAPYQHPLPQIESVRRLQPAGEETSALATGSTPSPLPPAKYSFNLRALRKWANERLQLKAMPDGSFEARFRYEGTTCSNMGRTLEFDYHVKLASPEDDCRIVDTSCAPVPGDTGHTCQCEYLNNPAAFMQSIASERPLLGRPLNDVLSWQRSCLSSGCYCDQERRTHKWGIVFEVIHYALAQRERELVPHAQGRSSGLLRRLSPHPGPLPEGEGESGSVLQLDNPANDPKIACPPVPSPWREGQGEGKGDAGL